MDAETLRFLITIVGATATFCWGLWTWRTARRDQLQAQRQEGERLAEARRIEATRPFLEKQLELYAEAARVCARIASAHDGADAVARFWELYWGELALVENREVEAKMVQFGQALQYMPEDRSELRHRALELAAACRASLARSWGVDAWVAPDLASERSGPPKRA
ncbi:MULTISPECIES: hypothetical protein [unclassified Lysobacter]|uniref:hypothetical protein n=1 Tax=unclassified Lysobacter TaxID=2635362 RepID=UPI0006FFC99F|nr:MULTISPECIES: hypothetical protein [unclassified Lysobacter]KQZ66209.1 hypothetical protein ASD53_17460 [Lysobacter sp. Root559]KRC30911.1 hypothetical protein ASE10_18685 [Lysobacter sp. Root76]KRD67699.1 hypothetical protein ASE45_13180 [Lysobacter sp. Root96]